MSSSGWPRTTRVPVKSTWSFSTRPPTLAATLATLRSSQAIFPTAKVSRKNSRTATFSVATFAMIRCVGFTATRPIASLSAAAPEGVTLS